MHSSLLTLVSAAGLALSQVPSLHILLRFWL